MSNRKYIDFKAIEKVPNKYNIKPEDIKKFKVLDWDKIKKKTWYNEAMKKTGEWYCHLEGGNGGGYYGDAIDDYEFEYCPYCGVKLNEEVETK